jgi:hypothetical protein
MRREIAETKIDRQLVDVAEVIRAYSYFRMPETSCTHTDTGSTLVDQSEGLAPLVPAADAEPAALWQSVGRHRDEVVRLYSAGHSLTSVATDVRIAWDSVARLLQRAGLRPRNRRC